METTYFLKDNNVGISEDLHVFILQRLEGVCKGIGDKTISYYLHSFRRNLQDQERVAYGGIPLGETYIRNWKRITNPETRHTITYDFLEFICFVIDLDLLKSLTEKYKCQQQNVRYYVPIPQKLWPVFFPKQVSADTSLINTDARLSSGSIDSGYEVIDEKYFARFRDAQSDTTSLENAFYTRFLSHRQFVGEIVAKGLYINPGRTFNFEIEEEQRNITIDSVIALATLGHPVLIKVLGNIGIGKTTFLWHLIEEFSHLYDCIYVSSIDKISLSGAVFENLPSDHLEVPLLVFIDNVVSANQGHYFAASLQKFGELIFDLGYKRSIVLVITERTGRYNSQVAKRGFEQNFLTITTLNYTNTHILDDVFNKVYSTIENQKEVPFSDLQINECKAIFNEFELESITDRIINLYFYLQMVLPRRDYDWDDWSNACKDEQNKVFGNLYTVVAFFYQFGIEVPVDYLQDLYRDSIAIEKSHLMDRFLDLIGSFRENDSPIEYEPVSRKIRLRNEKVAVWYFKVKGEHYAIECLEAFLHTRWSGASAYLFYKLYKVLAEISNTKFHKVISFDRAEKLIDRYLSGVKPTMQGNIEIKLLLLLADIYSNRGQADMATATLRRTLYVTEIDVDAATRIATQLLYSDPIEVEKLYRGVLEKDTMNTYARFGLYKLYHATKNWEQFFEIEKGILDISRGHYRFLKVFLDYLTIEFERIPKSTIEGLLLLNKDDKLCLELVNFLINSRMIDVAFRMLIDFHPYAEQMDYRTANRVSNLFIEIAKKSGRSDRKLLSLLEADLCVKIGLRQYPDNPYAIFLNAKIAFLRGESDRADELFTQSYQMNPRGDLFSAICRFRIQQAQIFQSNDTHRSIQILTRSVFFIQSVIDADPGHHVINRFLQLVDFRGKLAEMYFRVGNHFDNVLENQSEAIDIALGLVAHVKRKLQQLEREYFLSPLKNRYFSQLARIKASLGELYLDAANRAVMIPNNSPLHIDQCNSTSAEEYYRLADLYLKEAHTGGRTDAKVVLKLVKVKLKLRQYSELGDLLKVVNFSKFTDENKIHLCYQLVLDLMHDTARELLLKFGTLHAAKEASNLLLFECYVKCSVWDKASKLLNEIDNSKIAVLRLIGEIAFFIPLTTEQACLIGKIMTEKLIQSLEIYEFDGVLGKYNWAVGLPYRDVLFLNIVRIEYNSLEFRGSEVIYTESVSNETKQKMTFNLFRKILMSETVQSLHERSVIAASKLRHFHSVKIYSQNIFILKAALDLPLRYASIGYNYRNENSNFEGIKASIRVQMNAIFGLFIEDELYRDAILNDFYRCIRDVRPNVLFYKILLEKLIKLPGFSKTFSLLVWQITERHQSDVDVLLLLSRLFLSWEDFSSALHWQAIASEYASLDIHRGRANYLLADILLTSIEKFPTQYSLPEQISKVWVSIEQGKSFHPLYTYLPDLLFRYDLVKSRVV